MYHPCRLCQPLDSSPEVTGASRWIWCTSPAISSHEQLYADCTLAVRWLHIGCMLTAYWLNRCIAPCGVGAGPCVDCLLIVRSLPIDCIPTAYRLYGDCIYISQKGWLHIACKSDCVWASCYEGNYLHPLCRSPCRMRRLPQHLVIYINSLTVNIRLTYSQLAGIVQ